RRGASRCVGARHAGVDPLDGRARVERISFERNRATLSVRPREGVWACIHLRKFDGDGGCTGRAARHLPLKGGGRRAKRGGWGSLRRSTIPTRPPSAVDLPLSGGGDPRHGYAHHWHSSVRGEMCAYPSAFAGTNGECRSVQTESTLNGAWRRGY